MTTGAVCARHANAPRMVCLDIDGTLAHPDGAVSDAVASAVRRLWAGGASIVLATGRSLSATEEVFAHLGIAGHAVCSNGALTAHVPAHGVPAQILGMRRLNQLPAIDSYLAAAHLDARIAVEGPWLGFRVNREFPAGDLLGPSTVIDWPDLIVPEAIRITIRPTPGTDTLLMQGLRARGITSAKYDVMGRGWVDITPSGVSKASALEDLRLRLGVARSETYAAGDQVNDIEMLRWAAHSLAMGGSPAELQAAADRVAGTVASDGVLDLLLPLLEDAATLDHGPDGRAAP